MSEDKVLGVDFFPPPTPTAGQVNVTADSLSDEQLATIGDEQLAALQSPTLVDYRSPLADEPNAVSVTPEGAEVLDDAEVDDESGLVECDDESGAEVLLDDDPAEPVTFGDPLVQLAPGPEPVYGDNSAQQY